MQDKDTNLAKLAGILIGVVGAIHKEHIDRPLSDLGLDLDISLLFS